MKSLYSVLGLSFALAGCVPAHLDGPARPDHGSWVQPKPRVVPLKPGLYITENPDGTTTTTIVEPPRPSAILQGKSGLGQR